MRRILWLTFALLLIVAVAGLNGCDSITSPPAANSAGTSSQNTGIWVTGEGKVTVVPDVALLSLGVEAQADTVAKAQADATTAMSAVMNGRKNAKIDDKKIKQQRV